MTTLQPRTTIRPIQRQDEPRWRMLWDAYARFYERAPVEAISPVFTEAAQILEVGAVVPAGTRELVRPNEATSRNTGSGKPLAINETGRQNASFSIVASAVGSGWPAAAAREATGNGGAVACGTATADCDNSPDCDGGAGSKRGCSKSALALVACSAFRKNSVMFPASAT